MSKRHIRSYHIDDVDALAAMACDAMAYPWSRSVFVDSFAAKYQGWVLCDDLSIRGFIIIRPIVDNAEIMLLCVDPLFQRQGIARMLVEHTNKIMRMQGYVQLQLEVRASNVAAIALYEGFGFARNGLRLGYYPCEKGREDAVLMSAPL
jgi:[ribosomal protein S18]-alanine N-acetyltransferase